MTRLLLVLCAAHALVQPPPTRQATQLHAIRNWWSGASSDRDWRAALRDHLASIQQDDGTWINGKNGRWMENVPMLCTCYAMAALERCK